MKFICLTMQNDKKIWINPRLISAFGQWSGGLSWVQIHGDGESFSIKETLLEIFARIESAK